MCLKCRSPSLPSQNLLVGGDAGVGWNIISTLFNRELYHRFFPNFNRKDIHDNDIVIMSGDQMNLRAGAAFDSTFSTPSPNLENPSNTDMDAIKDHSRYFESLINLIPAKFYLINSVNDTAHVMSHGIGLNTKYMHNTKKSQRTSGDVENLKNAKKESRKRKLDPDLCENVVELQKKVNDMSDGNLNVTVGSNAAENADFSQVNAIMDKQVPASIEDLKEKLRKKIDLLKQKRQPTSEKSVSSNSNQNVAAKSREDILEQRKKRKIDKKKKFKQESILSTGSGKAEKRFENKIKSSDNTINNGDDDIQFNQISFDITGDSRPKAKKMDQKQALEKVKAKMQKIEEAKESEPEKAAKMEEVDKWKKAFAMAEGQKVLDDPKLLKKSIKKKEKRKEKSKIQWKKRIKTIENQKIEKQKKRLDNIKARSQQKIEKKLTKKKKKRAGF